MKVLQLKPYIEQQQEWPTTGKHIMAQYDDDSIVVYQAFKKEIASWAVQNQYFGGPHYKTTRMTWIKTNFLWMQYRSNWSSKVNQEHTLAIWIKRSAFETFLEKCRIQWDPDHRPNGENCRRRAIQIGVKGNHLKGFLVPNGDIIQIQDITEFCRTQYLKNVKGKKGLELNFKDLVMPYEREYILKDEKLIKRLEMDSK